MTARAGDGGEGLAGEEKRGEAEVVGELRTEFEARAARAGSSDSGDRFARALFSGDLSVTLPGERTSPGA
jgi:hypothetical protein